MSKKLKVHRYTSDAYQQWNSFLSKTPHYSLLFHRDFCEYHAERFKDHSVLIYQAQRLVALFIANELPPQIYSHAGLTYGGLIVAPGTNLQATLQYFYHLLRYYHELGYEQIVYQQMPYYYRQQTFFEEEYALFLLNACLYRRDTALVIDLRHGLELQKRRQRSIQKAKQKGVMVLEEATMKGFWQDVLVPNLQQRFGVAPTHSLAEIALLKEKFPQQIRQFSAFVNGQIVAGTTIFEMPNVAHAQYIATNDIGKQCGAIDLVVDTLLQNTYKEFDYFSLGITNEQQGRYLNKGLTEWKEGFGARVWAHNFYTISTKNYILLSNLYE